MSRTGRSRRFPAGNSNARSSRRHSPDAPHCSCLTSPRPASTPSHKRRSPSSWTASTASLTSRSSTCPMSSARSNATSTASCSCAEPSSSTGRPRAFRTCGTTRPTSMFESEFMRLAFAAGAIVGLLAPAVGFFLVQRGMSLIGDGIGHVAFAGVAAGYLLGLSPVLTALVAAVAGGLTIEWLRANRRTAGDQALAFAFYTGIAGGVVLVSAAGAFDVDLFSFLFGSILTVTPEDVVIAGVLGAAGLVAILLLYRSLAALVLAEEAAAVAGVPVRVLNLVLVVVSA